MQLEDRLYSSSEVSRILGVSRRTLYRYLESGTLGSMHLPSGRHRFTKDQVEAFLVKTFGTSSVKSESIVKDDQYIPEEKFIEQETTIEEPIERPSIFSKIKAQIENEAIAKEEEIEKEIIVEDIVEPLDEVEEIEEIDEIHETDEEDEINEVQEIAEEEIKIEEPVKVAPVKKQVEEDVDEVVEDLKKTLSSLFDDSPEEEVKVEKKEKKSFVYYSSSITDLKKLAKTVKVASENSNVQYAFTGQAGASLFGEVSPFGQLHLYIRKNDMLFFEKRFDLQEVAEEESNVALKVVDDLPEHTIVMGFKVVNLPILKKDLIELGDSATASNLEG